MKTTGIIITLALLTVSSFAGTLRLNIGNTTKEVPILNTSEITYTLDGSGQHKFTGARISLLTGENSKAYEWKDGNTIQYYNTPKPNGVQYKNNTWVQGNEILNPQPSFVSAGVDIIINGEKWINRPELIKTSEKTFTMSTPINFYPNALTIKGNPIKNKPIIKVEFNGDASNIDGTVDIFVESTPLPSPTINALNFVSHDNRNIVIFLQGEQPKLYWEIYDDGSSPSIITPIGNNGGTIGSGTNTEGPVNPSDLPPNVIFDDGKNNNGHGNNIDGVDAGNPGQGVGGPTGLLNQGLDPSGIIDDEITKQYRELLKNK